MSGANQGAGVEGSGAAADGAAQCLTGGCQGAGRGVPGTGGQGAHGFGAPRQAGAQITVTGATVEIGEAGFVGQQAGDHGTCRRLQTLCQGTRLTRGRFSSCLRCGQQGGRSRDPAITRPGPRLGRRIEQRQACLVHRQQRQRTARHVQGTEKGAGPGAFHHQTPLAQLTQCRPRHQGEFQRWRRAQTIDQQRQAGARGIAAVFDEGIQQPRHGSVGAQPGAALDALLAMDAEAPFHLVVRQLETRVPYGGYGAGAQGHAHAAQVGARGAGQGSHLGQRPSSGGSRASQLVDQHGTRDAAALIQRHGMAQGGVVRHQHRLDRNAFTACQFGGQAEVEAVARVVLDHQQRAGRTGRGPDGGQHGIHAG